MYAHSPLPIREGGPFKWLSAYAGSRLRRGAIKRELRENGVGEIEARIMRERERGKERITLKGKAYFRKKFGE